jgi:hypothetical protein
MIHPEETLKTHLLKTIKSEDEEESINLNIEN